MVSSIVLHTDNLILGMSGMGVARMVRDNKELMTEMTLRASKRVIVPPPTKEYPHEWLQGTWFKEDKYGTFEQTFWYYTNDRSNFQYKALVYYDHQLEAYRAVLRRATDQTFYGGDREVVMEIIAGIVQEFLDSSYDFYGAV